MDFTDSSIVKRGFLVKKGHVRHNWRTRWFELTNQDLRYYRNTEDRTPAGVINLAGAILTCPTQEEYKKPWVIQIKSEDGPEYWIQAPDMAAREEWRSAIEGIVRMLDRLCFSPDRGSTRLNSNSIGATYTKRDIVQAMQDKTGGVKLREIKCKGARQSTKYFTGRAVLDWLISWSFCSTRPEAIKLASSLLKYSYINPVKIDLDKGQYQNVKDDQSYSRAMADKEDAYYIFVCFAPGEEIDLFGPCDVDSDSDSEDDLLQLSSKLHQPLSIEVGEERVLKQGFLRKKGHLRHNWKPRLFVLKEKQELLYYYRGSKQMSKPLGTISLKDLSVLALDNEGDTPELARKMHCSTPTEQPASSNGTSNGTSEASATTSKKRSKSKLKLNRILLTTATGARYVLEAASVDDRDIWISEIKIASKLISH